MLAGLLKAPSTYAPTGNMDRARDRAAVVIGLMEEQGYLTKAEVDEARANPAELSQAAKQKSGGFFADWVMETTPDYLARDTTEDVIIETTLDQKMQAQAEEALKWVFDNKVKEGSKVQAAIVVMSADGAVRAMVGRGRPGAPRLGRDQPHGQGCADPQRDHDRRHDARIAVQWVGHATALVQIDTGKRIDGRDLKTVRNIVAEAGVLPRAHG